MDDVTSKSLSSEEQDNAVVMVDCECLRGGAPFRGFRIEDINNLRGDINVTALTNDQLIRVYEHTIGRYRDRLKQVGIPRAPRNESELVMDFLKVLTLYTEKNKAKYLNYFNKLLEVLRRYDSLRMHRHDSMKYFIRDIASRLRVDLAPTVRLTFAAIRGYYFARKYELKVIHNHQQVKTTINLVDPNFLHIVPTPTVPFTVCLFEDIWCLLYEGEKDAANLNWIGSTAVLAEALFLTNEFKVTFQKADITVVFTVEMCSFTENSQ
ncbi:hypothetical protein BIW11_08223 [Tropilaelaps mercedesae]|uniref:Uncharacterized protein n=1 Tax=Tropilaelaps mercedesae TaxID=418985 RepID=A0A1V9XQH8_9ACAR|nr:hypothetical protein BIW11_08223 [Tropilaelaps mercedesae]